MAIVRNGALITDVFVDVSDAETIAEDGPVLISLQQWQTNRENLLRRTPAIGLRLNSDEHPEALGDDVHHFDMIALEFPSFRDGRAYSYARLLRERFGFKGEIRAVGDVLLDQLHFMERVGFDAFDIPGEDPLGTFKQAMGAFKVWYQPAADSRPWAARARHQAD